MFAYGQRTLHCSPGCGAQKLTGCFSLFKGAEHPCDAEVMFWVLQLSNLSACCCRFAVASQWPQRKACASAHTGVLVGTTAAVGLLEFRSIVKFSLAGHPSGSMRVHQKQLHGELAKSTMPGGPSFSCLVTSDHTPVWHVTAALSHSRILSQKSFLRLAWGFMTITE